MKKTLYLIIALMLAITITGCSSSSKTDDKEDVKKTEEKTTKNETKKEEKKEDKKEEKKENNKGVNVSTVDNILTCKMEQEDYSGTADIIWVDGLIKEIDFVIDIPLTDPSITDDIFDTVVETTKQLMEAQYGIDENTKGVTLVTKADKETKVLTFNIYIDLTEASQDVLEKIGFSLSEDDLKASIDDIKSEMEQTGFTCTKKFN